MKSKSQHMIKAQTLNTTLPTIIIICYIYVTARIRLLGWGGCIRTLQSIQKCCAKLYHQTLVIVSIRLEVLYVLQKLEYKLSWKNYLQINAFLDLVMVEQEEYPHAL